MKKRIISIFFICVFIFTISEQTLLTASKRNHDIQTVFANSKNKGKPMAGWKKAYIRVIKNLDRDRFTTFNSLTGKADWSRNIFSLININGDKIPELHIAGNCEAAGQLICSYYKGKVFRTNFQRSSWAYKKNKNVINNTGGHMGHYFDIIYKIKKGRLTKIIEGNYGEVINTDVNSQKVKFYWNWDGKKVNKKEYKKNMKKYFSKKGVSKPPKAYNKRQIISQIRDY